MHQHAWLRRLACGAAAVLAAMALPGRLPAQAGWAPGTSPARWDIAVTLGGSGSAPRALDRHARRTTLLLGARGSRHLWGPFRLQAGLDIAHLFASGQSFLPAPQEPRDDGVFPVDRYAARDQGYPFLKASVHAVAGTRHDNGEVRVRAGLGRLADRNIVTREVALTEIVGTGRIRFVLELAGWWTGVTREVGTAEYRDGVLIEEQVTRRRERPFTFVLQAGANFGL